jgi:hypothetical protein
VRQKDKPLAWLHGEVKTPPFSKAARLEAGFLLRQLQRGELLSMPKSRPMPSIGHDATSYESTTLAAIGVWSTGLIPTPS